MIPEWDKDGNLPVGIHRASLQEALDRFGTGAHRRTLGHRLERVCGLAFATDQVRRLIVFGSFVTSKAEPNDIDVFLLMEDSFDLNEATGETRILFEHGSAQSHFGSSVFWLRRSAALGGEERAIEDWQIRRDGGRRGIIEIIRRQT